MNSRDSATVASITARFDDSWASCAVDCVGIRFRVAGCNGCLWVWLQAWYAGMFSDVFTVLLQNIHLAVELDKCVKCWTLGWKLVVSCYRSALHAELITPSITCHTVIGKQDAATSCSFQRILLTWCNMDSGTLTPCHIGIITKWSWCHCLVADTIQAWERSWNSWNFKMCPESPEISLLSWNFYICPDFF